jgi:hypothetical protein
LVSSGANARTSSSIHSTARKPINEKRIIN